MKGTANILTAANIEIVYRELKEAVQREGVLLEDGTGKLPERMLRKMPVLGFIDRRRGEPDVILINPQLTYREKVETLFHEMAHYFFHLNDGSLAADAPGGVRKAKEKEAKAFASWLINLIDKLLHCNHQTERRINNGINFDS